MLTYVISGEIIREQSNILKFLGREKVKLTPVEWQRFTTHALKIKALAFLNPETVGTKDFSLDGFRKAIAVDPELRAAGEAWLKKYK